MTDGLDAALAGRYRLPDARRRAYTWADPAWREQILFAARSVETEFSLIGFSDHLIAAATRP